MSNRKPFLSLDGSSDRSNPGADCGRILNSCGPVEGGQERVRGLPISGCPLRPAGHVGREDLSHAFLLSLAAIAAFFLLTGPQSVAQSETGPAQNGFANEVEVRAAYREVLSQRGDEYRALLETMEREAGQDPARAAAILRQWQRDDRQRREWLQQARLYLGVVEADGPQHGRVPPVQNEHRAPLSRSETELWEEMSSFRSMAVPETGDGPPSDEAIEAWLAERRQALRRCAELRAAVRAALEADLSSPESPATAEQRAYLEATEQCAAKVGEFLESGNGPDREATEQLAAQVDALVSELATRRQELIDRVRDERFEQQRTQPENQ